MKALVKPIPHDSVPDYVVDYYIRGMEAPSILREGAYEPSVPGLIQTLKTGLKVEEFEELRQKLDVSIERLADILGISRATLHRRRLSGRFQMDESDRILRLARLLGRAAEVMESLEDGRQWLASPQIGLGGAVPLDYAETEFGAREVENLLGRIEYGVYA